METIQVTNPANSKVIGSFESYDQAKVLEAVKTARKGFSEWSIADISTRKEILLRYCSLLSKNADKLAKTVTEQMGKPITQSLGDANDVGGDTEWFVNNAQASVEAEKIDGKSTLFWEPLGVVGCIKAWNFPLDLVTWSAVPALMAGNSVVLKHSELVPYSGRQIADLMHAAGVPEDVFVLVEGAGETGKQLVESPVDCITFTGSSKAGKDIAQRCATGYKKSVLELGGSAPAIVFSDADIDKAVATVSASRLGNCGQVCSAAKRLIIQSSISKDFISALKAKMEAAVIGDPMEKSTSLGPLATFAQRERLEKQVADAKAKGGKILIGGNRPVGKQFEKGAFYEPTIILDTPFESAAWREETFGPALAVRTFDTEEEAVALANDSDYGLSAQVYTQDSEKAARVASKIIAGTVIINGRWAGCGQQPWFGVKASGWGFEGTKYGFREFTRPKHVYQS